MLTLKSLTVIRGALGAYIYIPIDLTVRCEKMSKYYKPCGKMFCLESGLCGYKRGLEKSTCF